MLVGATPKDQLSFALYNFCINACAGGVCVVLGRKELLYFELLWFCCPQENAAVSSVAYRHGSARISAHYMQIALARSSGSDVFWGHSQHRRCAHTLV